MLSFKDLTEKKKTPCKINPSLEDIKEGDKKKCSKCDGKGCEHCDNTGYHAESCGGSHSKKKKKPMSEAKKKDDTYLETDFKKRQANNEKARKDLMKGPQMKNPHLESKWYDPMEDPDFDHDEAERTRGQSGKPAKKKKTTKEETAYVSQEEVSEESNQSIDQEETSLLTFGQFSEGMSMKDFKANRTKLKRREASADAEKRGHVGKEWHNTGRKYSPDEAKHNRAKMDDEERRTRHRSAVDPDDEDDNNYSADKTKNPKKQRKQAAMGESTVVHKMGGVVMGKTKTADGKDTVKVDDAPVSKSTYDFMQKKGMNKVDSSGKPTADTTYDERKAAGLKTVKKVEEALTGERYKKAVKKPGGIAYSRMVSADPKKRATRGGRGGESDFGAGDRGSGNKAARRAGTYQEEYVDERTRYAKETGKDFQTGKPSEKGGTLGGDDRHSKVMRHMQKDLRKSGGLMSSRGKPIKPQGKKKDKGAKPSFKMEPTSVDKIKAKLAQKRKPKPDISSRFD
jgi:hypothetical protein